MIQISTILESYLRAIQALSEARAVTFYLPSPDFGGSGALLHRGEGPPPPELEDADTAGRFVATQESVMARTVGEGSPAALAFQLRSVDPDCRVVWVPFGARAAAETRRPSERRSAANTQDGGVWVGFRFCPDRKETPLQLVPLSAAPEGETQPAWSGLLTLGGMLASFGMEVARNLKDPISGLPDRRGFNSLITNAFERASSSAHPVALLFINPDEFLRVNELFGHQAGDEAVREISARLRDAVRAEDFVTRYGGVTFAAILVGNSAAQAAPVAQRVLHGLSEEPYLEGSLQLDFSIGLTVFEPSVDVVDHPLQLIRQADQALSTAKRRGGATVVMWEEAGAEQIESFDRLTGIFTGNAAKDYRNMVLLWDTVNVIAQNDEVETLAAQATQKLIEVLKPERVGLYSTANGGDPVLLRGYERNDAAEAGVEPFQTGAIDGPRVELMSSALAEFEPRESLLPAGAPTHEGEEQEQRRCCAVPLTKADRCIGVLYLEWREHVRELDTSDLLFLKALGLQLAMALDRIRLGELELERQEAEKRSLRAELNELRQAVQRAKLVYRSPQMEEVMTRARRVAGSDATVLITGPSGTGKELLARTIHELSPRKSKEFVIVDCGAIPTTLIESELFGHEKGAYTSADRRSAGLIAKADGGTVLLDEIGELPLAVQSKLLRFVQDKVFTSVGGNRPRKVDVRLLAATNRRLADEVASGGFREDLFYRLNVVNLKLPALADRPDDVMLLAHHFLELYAVHYQKNIRGFSRDAGTGLLAHSWPGNVRELQNRIMQAVLLCEHDVLTAADLDLAGSPAAALRPEAAVGSSEPAYDADWVAEDPAPPAAAGFPRAAPDVAGLDGGLSDGGLTDGRLAGGESLEALVEDLRRRLAGYVGAVNVNASDTLPPLGRWLDQEMLLAADEASDGVLNRGAEILGIPATTYRRRLRRAVEGGTPGLAERPSDWGAIRGIAHRLAAHERARERGLLALAEHVLLTEIVSRSPGNTSLGSALLGVTPPTFRRRVAALGASEKVPAQI